MGAFLGFLGVIERGWPLFWMGVVGILGAIVYSQGPALRDRLLGAPLAFFLLGPLPAREAYGETDHTVDGTRKLFLRGGAAHWKAILSLSPDGTETRKEEWYDLASDPGERESIVPLPAVADPIRRRARERWRGDRGGGVAARPVCLSPEQQERLRALGYVSGAPDEGCPPARAEPAPSPVPRGR